MTEPSQSGADPRVRSLEAEVLAMRQQIELRDELLRVLNRRLLQLERGEADTRGIERMDPRVPKQQNNDLRSVVQALLSTDMFRWTLPARRFHGKVHARRQGSR